jgi:hypothetical protein
MPKTTFEIVSLILVILFVAYLKRDELKEAFSKQPAEVELEEGYETLETIKDHYTRLVDLLIHNSDKNDLKKHINAIDNAQNPENPNEVESEMEDEVYFSNILYRVMDAPMDFPAQMVYTLDWKDGVTELVSCIETALGDDIKNINMPDINNFPKNRLLSMRTIKAYQKALLKDDVVMGFIEMGQDTYYIIFHQNSNWQEVQNLIGRVGLRY